MQEGRDGEGEEECCWNVSSFSSEKNVDVCCVSGFLPVCLPGGSSPPSFVPVAKPPTFFLHLSFLSTLPERWPL